MSFKVTHNVCIVEYTKLLFFNYINIVGLISSLLDMFMQDFNPPIRVSTIQPANFQIAIENL